ncbi:MAG TPA: RNA polymerase sigma-70 factor [Cytophagaceae bacterium]|jgi:RNA polymerase sigma-70 factor (ECF subfamily)
MEKFKEKDFLLGLREGDLKTYELFFKYFSSELYSFSLKFVKAKDVAEEVVHDVFIKIWQSRETIQIQSSLRSYLYTAVKNQSLDYIKKELKFAHSAIDNAANIEGDSAQEHAMEYIELQNTLKISLDSLPERCRLIFNMSREDGLTYRQIAESLNISVKTVETQMGIALKKIRDYVGAHWEQFVIIYFFLI